jgi:hypothetical protein
MLNPNLVVSTISHKIKLCISYSFNPYGINIILTADEAGNHCNYDFIRTFQKYLYEIIGPDGGA